MIKKVPPFVVIVLAATLECAHANQGEFVADVSTCLVKPRQIVQLGSSVFGVLAELNVDRADKVKKGQVIGKLDTSVEEAQLALDRYRASNVTEIEAAKADLDWNERELARRGKLANNMWSRANDVDEAATKVQQDKIAIEKAQNDLKVSELEAARSKAQFDMKFIRSPVDGVVSEIKLMPGEFIFETTPIMTIAQMDPLNVDLVLPAEQYRAVKKGAIVELNLLSPVDRTLKTEVEVIDPLIDPASNTFRVRLTLPNPDYLIPAGVRCTAHLPGAPDG